MEILNPHLSLENFYEFNYFRQRFSFLSLSLERRKRFSRLRHKHIVSSLTPCVFSLLSCHIFDLVCVWISWRKKEKYYKYNIIICEFVCWYSRQCLLLFLGLFNLSRSPTQFSTFSYHISFSHFLNLTFEWNLCVAFLSFLHFLSFFMKRKLQTFFGSNNNFFFALHWTIFASNYGQREEKFRPSL